MVPVGHFRFVVADGHTTGTQLSPQAIPQSGALPIGVGVEASPFELARPVIVVEHGIDDRADASVVNLNTGCFGGLSVLGVDLAHELEVEFVSQLQRRCRVAGLAARRFDHGRVDALGEHPQRFVQHEPNHARCVEPARIIDDDGRLADLLREVESSGESLVIGLVAFDDLDERHFVHGGEEVDADEVLGASDAFSETRDRQRRGVGSEEAVVGDGLFNFGPHFVLELGVFEDRFDDDVAVGKVGVVGRRGDAIQEGLRFFGGGTPPVQRFLLQPLRVGLSAFGIGEFDVLQRDLEPRLRRDIGNAGTHHSRADHAQLFKLFLLDVLGSRTSTITVLQIEEKRLHHVGCCGPGDQLNEVSSFYVEGVIEIHLCPLNRCGQDRFRRGHRPLICLVTVAGNEGRMLASLGDVGVPPGMR